MTMIDKEKLMKVQGFINEEFFHHASRDFFNQSCVSYNYTELFTFAKSIIELLQEEPVSKDLEEIALSKFPVLCEKYYAIFGSQTSNDKNEEKRKCFVEGAKWQKEQTINKACEWLKHRGCLYIKYTEAGTGFDDERFIKDFRKAMED